MSLATSKISADDLRAAIARSGIPAYVIAARARVNPIKLSRLTRGHCRITNAVAARILLAIKQEAEPMNQPEPLAQMCRDLITQLLRDKKFSHRELLLKEVKKFIEAHGAVPELEALLKEQDQ